MNQNVNKNTNKKQSIKIILTYLAVAVFTFAVDHIYAIFGHGVSSAAMTWMFMYPLAGGLGLYLMISLFLPKINYFIGYRLFCNIYNSGIALFTVGSFLKGILEIAGTSSAYNIFFYIAGGIFTSTAIVLLGILALNVKKVTLVLE